MHQQGSPPQDHQRILRVIESVRNLARGRIALEGLTYVLAALLTGLVVGAAVFVWAPPVLWLRVLVALGILAAVAVALWRQWLLPGKHYDDLREVARRVEAWFPAFRNDITASLEFGEQLDALRSQNQISTVMIERLMAQTSQSVQSQQEKIKTAVPKPKLKLPLGLGAAALVIAVASFAIAPTSAMRGLRGLLLGPEVVVDDDTGRARVAIIGDLMLHYQYPEYTGLGRKVLQNSTGDIEVLKGTRVELEGIALRPVERAELVLTLDVPPKADQEGEETSETAPDEAQSPKVATGETTQRLVLERRTGGRLVASFTALHSGSYTIEAVLKDGTEVFDGIDRTVQVLPDAHPKIEVTRPTGEVDVSPEDVVTFAWLASDDFGVGEVAIVTAFEGDAKNKKRIVIRGADDEPEILPGDARPTSPAQRPQGLPPGLNLTPRGMVPAPKTSQDEGAAQSLRQMQGEYKLDLAPLKLQPKDSMVVMLEVVDNDTISGPKVTTSAPIVLKVSSPEDKHLELIDDQEQLIEALLDLLADYLEKPIGDSYLTAQGKKAEGIVPAWDAATLSARYRIAQTTYQKATGVLTTMKSLVERMEQDPLMLKRDYELFVRTRRDLDELHDKEDKLFTLLRLPATEERLNHRDMGRLFQARVKTVRGTERAIITMEDLVASQRMENLLDSTRDLKEAKERLKELLEKYKDTKDPEVKAEIMRQMKRLRDRMREVMKKMQSQIKNLPKEHMNTEALERKEMAQKAKSAADSMEEMMKALERGDIDAAMEMMEKMDEDIDSMLSEMEQDFEESKPEGLSELDKKASEMMDAISDLENQERAIAEETDKIAKEMEEQHKAAMDQQMDSMAQQAQAQLESIRRDLEAADQNKLRPREKQDLQRAMKRAEELEQAIEDKDLGQAMEKASELTQDLERSQFGLEFQQNTMRRQSSQKQSYQKANQQVKKAQKSAQGLEKQLQGLMQKGGQPQPNAEQRERLSEQKKQQGQARQGTRELQKKLDEAGKDFPMLKEELGPGLGEAQQFMEGAEKRLGQAQGRKAHENEKLAMDKLGGLKQSLKKALKKERMGGNKPGQQQSRKTSQEKVEIPGRNDQAPKEFRGDIMEAMKDKALDDYSDELDAYYKSLVQ